MNILVNMIGGSIETLLVVFISLKILNISFKMKDFLFIFTISTVTSLYIFLFKEVLPSWFYILLMVSFLSFILSQKFKFKVHLTFFAVIVGSITLLLVTLLDYRLLLYVLPGHTPDILVDTLCMLVNVLLIGCLNLLFRRKHFNLFNASNMYDITQRSKKNHVFLIIFVLLLYLLGAAYYLNSKIIISHIRISTLAFVVLFGFVLISMIGILIYYEQEKVIKELELINLKNGELYMGMVKSQRHDMIFHLSSIQSMVTLRKYEELNQYLSTITNQVNQVNDTLLLHSHALSALLFSFIQKAEQEKIQFRLDIQDDLKQLRVRDYEMNSIIGNLIQNAFEHVQTAREIDRKVILHISSEKDHYLISVSNYGNIDMNLLTDVNDLFKDGFTTKENGHLGNGLFSVKRLAEKYKGHVYPEFSENEVTFNIIFPKGMAV